MVELKLPSWKQKCATRIKYLSRRTRSLLRSCLTVSVHTKELSLLNHIMYACMLSVVLDVALEAPLADVGAVDFDLSRPSSFMFKK